MKTETITIADKWFDDGLASGVTRTVNPPVYRGSTILFRNYAEMTKAGKGELEGPVYGTDRLPVQRSLEQAVRKLEHGVLTRVFPSGLAAIQQTFLAFCKTGDHVLLVDNAYYPGVSFCKKVLAKFGIENSPVPADVGADIERYVRPNTRLILLESPGSNTFEIQDIPAVTSFAGKNGILTAIDNTWATPLFLQPFELGVDISIQSISKYMAGYSDVLMGAVTTNRKCAGMLQQHYRDMEFYTPDNDCYLALRGLKTMAVRLRQHQQSALLVASFLTSHDKVAEVMHPALPGHPQHHIFRRDFKGSSGLFAFTLKKEYSQEQLAAFTDALKLFVPGYSWGGYQSLITIGKPHRSIPAPHGGKTIIRLNIGLEDHEDLIADLKQGLSLLK